MRPLSDTLQRHFEAPEHIGKLASPAVSGAAENAACGDDLRIYALGRCGVVAEVRFQARACSAVIAVASLVVAELSGLAVEDVGGVDVAGLVDRAGGLGGTRRHAVGVVERALAELGARLVGATHGGAR